MAHHTPLPRVAGIGLALAGVLAVVVLAFSWPAVTADPRNVPIGVVDPAPAVSAMTANLAQAQPGAIDLHPYVDRAAAVRAIEARDVYGAIVLGPEPEVLTASAGSTVIAQMLGGVAAELQRQAQAPATVVRVTDVVPLSTDDPRGTGLTAAMFPLLLGGMIGGIAISLAVIGAMRRVVAVALYAVAGGVVLAAVMQSWFGSLQGNWGLNAAAIALCMTAIAAPITGLVALVGRTGIALGPVLFMLVGNPISGATIPPQFLPGAWGGIGQWLPPGASATLLRDLSYFASADASLPWLVLGAWAVAGLVLSLVGHLRTAGGAEPDAEAALEH